MISFFKHFLNGLRVVEDVGRIATIVTMTLLVFIQVMARIFFKWSSPAMEEAARFIMIWSIFIGAVVTTREDSHIRMGALFNGLHSEKWFALISNLVGLAFLCVFVSWSYDYAAYSLRKGMESIVLGVPLVVVHVCFLVTGVLMAFHSLVHLFDKSAKLYQFYAGGRK